MTVEYILLLSVMFMFGIKMFVSMPVNTMKQSAPKLGARVEAQLATGRGFESKQVTNTSWKIK